MIPRILTSLAVLAAAPAAASTMTYSFEVTLTPNGAFFDPIYTGDVLIAQNHADVGLFAAGACTDEGDFGHYCDPNKLLWSSIAENSDITRGGHFAIRTGVVTIGGAKIGCTPGLAALVLACDRDVWDGDPETKPFDPVTATATQTGFDITETNGSSGFSGLSGTSGYFSYEGFSGTIGSFALSASGYRSDLSFAVSSCYLPNYSPTSPGTETCDVEIDLAGSAAATLVSTPLPATLPMLAGGLALAGYVGWRRRARA